MPFRTIRGSAPACSAFSQGELPECGGGKTSELLCNKSICNPDMQYSPWCDHPTVGLWCDSMLGEFVYRKVNKCPQKQQNKKRCGCPYFFQFKGPKNCP